MKFSDKTLAFDKHLWVQFDGVDMKETGGEVKLTGRDEESYLKVFNHFGRVLKLYIFEDGKWVDSDTGLAARPFDESHAGRLPDAPPGAAKKVAAKKAAKNKAAKEPAEKKTAVKKPAEKKSAAAKKAGAATKKEKAPARKAKTPAAGKKAGGKAKASKS